MAELDAEMRQKMSGLSGDGGEAGVEYEDGQPVAMKRSVKNVSLYILPMYLLAVTWTLTLVTKEYVSLHMTIEACWA